MDAQERDLEEIYDQIKQYEPFKPIPIFEVYISAFSILITITLFWFPFLMEEAKSAGTLELYGNLLEIMPQHWWAFVFALAALLKAFGLMFRFNNLRIAGLLVSAALYALIAFFFAMDYPNIGMIQFTCMAVFSLAAVFVVKHTTIRN